MLLLLILSPCWSRRIFNNRFLRRLITFVRMSIAPSQRSVILLRVCFVTSDESWKNWEKKHFKLTLMKIESINVKQRYFYFRFCTLVLFHITPFFVIRYWNKEGKTLQAAENVALVEIAIPGLSWSRWYNWVIPQQCDWTLDRLCDVFYARNAAQFHGGDLFLRTLK